ncbi:hypothetical protein [Helicobacter sp. 13S00477-4]|uniref:hypothetical protein n=1 Tax=Helicobacter sp. 13S00477-4 TaxID=1905759 RepID=UPI000BA63D62|nr:hypothetical protein [Helicobacter sp. 13S00477-4]PAF51980.1 hypothetical protein BKH44_04790 [Helicobacter sp. 13S00477-4]
MLDKDIPQEDQQAQNIPNNSDNASDDIDTDSQALEQLQKELEEAQANVNKNFSDYASARLEDSPELEELFFNDKKEFINALLQLQQNFIDENINSKRQKVSELHNSVMNKKINSQYQKAKNQFLQDNPNDNPDELISFAKDNIPPKQLNELTQLSPLEFLKAVKKIRDSNTSGQDSIPQELEGTPGDSMASGIGSRNARSAFSRD